MNISIAPHYRVFKGKNLFLKIGQTQVLLSLSFVSQAPDVKKNSHNKNNYPIPNTSNTQAPDVRFKQFFSE